MEGFYKNNISEKYLLKKINLLGIQKYDLMQDNSMHNLVDYVVINLKCVFLAEEDLLIKNNLLFLERITGQKAIGFGEFRFVGPAKKFYFTGKVTLRKKKMINFIIFLTICCLPIYYKRNGFIVEDVKKKVYQLKIIDFYIFPNFTFINITGNLVIKIVSTWETLRLKLEDYLRVIKIKAEQNEVFSSKR